VPAAETTWCRRCGLGACGSRAVLWNSCAAATAGAAMLQLCCPGPQRALSAGCGCQPRASTALRSMRRRSALLLMMGAACRRLCLQLTAKGGRHSCAPRSQPRATRCTWLHCRALAGPPRSRAHFCACAHGPAPLSGPRPALVSSLGCQQDRRWCLTPGTGAVTSSRTVHASYLLGRWAAPSLAKSSCAPAQVTSNRPQWGGQALSRERGAVRRSNSGTRLFAAPSRHQL